MTRRFLIREVTIVNNVVVSVGTVVTENVPDNPLVGDVGQSDDKPTS